MELTYVLLQVVVALLAIAGYSYYRTMTYFKRRAIPHDPPHLWLGNMRGFNEDRTVNQIMQDHYDRFLGTRAPFVGFYFFQKPVAFIMDLELVKHILIKDFSNFSDRGLFYNEKDDPMSAHLFNLDGPQWRLLRSKLSSIFTSGKMKFMFPTVVSVANELISFIHEKVEYESVLEIRNLISRFTVDVIGTCAFGIQCNSLRDEKAEFLYYGNRVLLDKRHGPLLHGFKYSYPKLAKRLGFMLTPSHIHKFYQRIVYETVAVREKENIRRNDFMDLLIDLKNKKEIILDNGDVVKGLTIDEVLAQCFVFFIAGSDPSSATIQYALYELTKNQDIQDRVRCEVEEVLERHDQELTYECLKDLKYLSMVVDETSRLYPIASHLIRKAHKRFVVPGHSNFVIEAGQMIFIPSSAIHHDPSIYPDPFEFRPERFSPEETAKRTSVAWLPFGDGPRNCIGLRFGQMQVRIGLALLIKNFKFSMSSETPDPLIFDPRSVTFTVLNGIPLRVETV
ncbi:cytochrome P450 6a8-like isoform X1 [Drosophila kikkawai]|uniref:Cytochrome P450 6a8-like n=1 Tax=Drosophila kikkawai TaxID=30033 RepID=A0ABM4GAA2_DROKI|nr:cytochrome P450 6a8-like [Drosophila kikkawai]